MKINWKDFVLMCVLGILSYFISLFLGSVIGIVSLVVLLVPGAFYFYRNSCDIKNAFVTSILFGFVLWPVTVIIYLGYIEMLASMAPYAPGYALLLPDAISLLMTWLSAALFFSVMAFIPHLLTKMISKPK